MIKLAFVSLLVITTLPSVSLAETQTVSISLDSPKSVRSGSAQSEISSAEEDLHAALALSSWVPSNLVVGGGSNGSYRGAGVPGVEAAALLPLFLSHSFKLKLGVGF